MAVCKHTDAHCPCQDGDLCHYEGAEPMTPPVWYYFPAKDGREALLIHSSEVEYASGMAADFDQEWIEVHVEVTEVDNAGS